MATTLDEIYDYYYEKYSYEETVYNYDDFGKPVDTVSAGTVLVGVNTVLGSYKTSSSEYYIKGNAVVHDDMETGIVLGDDELERDPCIMRMIRIEVADEGRVVIFRYFPHIEAWYDAFRENDGENIYYRMIDENYIVKDYVAENWEEYMKKSKKEIKINKDTKYFDLIAQELLKMNSQYYCGAWEIDKSGLLNFAIKIILEDNPLTPKLMDRIDRLSGSFGDIEKIIYMLREGKPMPKKPFESDSSNKTDENSI